MADKGRKQCACDTIDRESKSLYELSRSIWEHPELAYEEEHAHEVLTSYLEKHGFNVERHYKLDTAFRAEFSGEGGGEGGPHVAVLCEYDALPGIGHACGHNLIAEVGVAAGLGVKAAMSQYGTKGKVTVLGTPAEEGLGGKIDLIRARAFDDVDVAMMAHPTPITTATPACLAVATLTIKFHGKASHAAGFPWEGINALDAAVLCYQNLSCLRQQMKPNWRLHGIIVNGGAKPNIIPELTEMEYYVRAPTDRELQLLKQKVLQCVDAAALATGCTVEYEYHPNEFSNLVSNKTLASAFTANAGTVGIEFTPDSEIGDQCLGSTDMGNVSYEVPTIHPNYFVGTPGCDNHTPEFTDATGLPEAQSYTLDVSKALAMTALDVLTDSDLLSRIKQNFAQDMVDNKAS